MTPLGGTSVQFCSSEWFASDSSACSAASVPFAAGSTAIFIAGST